MIELQLFHLPRVGIGGAHLNVLGTAKAVVKGNRSAYAVF